MGRVRREAAVSMQRATGLIKGTGNYAKHREDPDREDGDENFQNTSDKVDDAVCAPGAAATPWNVAASVKARLEEELKRERSLSKRGLTEAQELGRPGIASPTMRSRQMSNHDEGIADDDLGTQRRARSNRPYRQRSDPMRCGAGGTGASSRVTNNWDCGWPPAPSVTEGATVTSAAPGEFDEAIYAALAALPAHSLVRVLGRLAQTRPAEVRQATSAAVEVDGSPGSCAHAAGHALVTGEDFASVTPQPAVPSAVSLPGGACSPISAAAAVAASAAVAPGTDAAAAAAAASVAAPASPWPANSQAEPRVPDEAWTASSNSLSHSPQAAQATAAWPNGGGSATWPSAGAWGC